MRSLTADLTATVRETERLGNFDAGVVPDLPDDKLDESIQAIEAMEDEGVQHQVHVSAINGITDDFIASAPSDMNIGDGTQCSGVGVRASSGGVVYKQQTLSGARTPEQHKQYTGSYPDVFKQTNTGTTTVATVRTIGRHGGDFGYASDGNLLIGSLASFTHNWVSKLIAYFERSNLPFKGEWNLPNMVLAETEQPDQFVPDASFAFSTRPSAFTTYTVVVQSPTPTTVGFDIWGPNKQSKARVEEVELPAGETRTVVNAGPFPPSSGYFNVVPRDAPKGLTVKEVSTQPISL